jgi:hypothetical protein
MGCSQNHFHAHFDEVDMIYKQLQGIVTISVILSTMLNCKKHEHLNTTVTLLLRHIIIIIRIQHIFFKFKVCKSVHHHTFQTNQPTRCNNFSSLLLDVYVQPTMFRASTRPSSGAQQLQ